MARVIKKENNEPPERKLDETNIVLAIASIIIVFICLWVYLITHRQAMLVIGGTALIVFAVAVVAALTVRPYSITEEEIKEFGNIGESATEFILEHNLPDEYTIIPNVELLYGDGRSEADNIIVGRSGVFIIEVKNMKGTVSGSCEDKQWIKDKVDTYNPDIVYQESFKNPVRQVKYQVHLLKNIFKENDIRTYIHCAVYFPNTQTVLNISDMREDIPIFTYKTTNDMLEYIENSTENLSQNQIERIINLLKELLNKPSK